MQNVKRTLMDQPVMAIRSIAKSKVGGKCIITRCKNWSVSNPSEVTYLSIAKLDWWSRRTRRVRIPEGEIDKIVPKILDCSSFVID